MEPPEGPVEAEGQEFLHHLDRGRVTSFLVREEDLGRLGESASGDIELAARILIARGDVLPPEADDGDLEQGPQLIA